MVYAENEEFELGWGEVTVFFMKFFFGTVIIFTVDLKKKNDALYSHFV